MADGSVFARVHVLVLCDEVERRPGKEVVFDLSGVRTQVSARSFPYTHPQLSVYLQVTGHPGAASGRVVVLNAATEEEIALKLIDEFQLLGPLSVFHLQVEITDCEFPEPGVYWFQVVLNEKLVAERRFLASEIPGDTNGQPLSSTAEARAGNISQDHGESHQAAARPAQHHEAFTPLRRPGDPALLLVSDRRPGGRRVGAGPARRPLPPRLNPFPIFAVAVPRPSGWWCTSLCDSNGRSTR